MALVVLMIVIGGFSIINNKTILTSTEAHTNTNTNPAILTYFIPLYNYYLWYNESLDEHSYWWVKESVLWWSLYLIIISIWPTTLAVFLGAFVIIARAIMVTVGMDIISSDTKKSINIWFYQNIEEFIAYPLGVIIHALRKLFQKDSTLAIEVDNWKLTYSHQDSIGNWRTIVSYLLVLAAIGYWGYMTWIASGPTV